jgi:hypothetical protein
VAHPALTAFAYELANYGHAWWFPEYEADLGAPLGPRRLVAGTRWRRDFERGYVEADPATAVGTIRATPPDTRIARARALAEQLLAVLDEPAPVT